MLFEAVLSMALLAATIKGEDGFSEKEPDKKGRQFSLFNIVNFKNDGCASTSSR